ncbi:sugar phosphate isomerase/epimerase family protein [Kribbella sp. NPDC059898]|uniref:sugar phosphate isomerase/epimerase family protein n=1 Tax=Kribbella sp. NPDC059898 TaxID=3346995 RepID=UPI0036550D4E
MGVGLDARHFPPEITRRGPHAVLDHAVALGAGGVFFRTLFDISPTLDPGLLREIRSHADATGLYLEGGLGKVNPFAAAETPELRAFGNGDVVLGIRRTVEAAAAIGLTDLWAGTANYKPQYAGILGFDRFRTDVAWSRQLAAISGFLTTLAPIVRDLGVHLNLETHEEITSFELVRIVEEVGPDVVGIVYDTANMLHRAEHPVHTARRVAPYVRQTHLKDAALRWVPDGAEYQLRPCGAGVVDFAAIVPLLLAHNPELRLTLECDDVRRPGEPPMSMLTELSNPLYFQGHPDLGVDEFLAYSQLVDAHEDRVRRGEVESFEEHSRRPFGLEQWNSVAVASAAYIAVVEASTELAQVG